MSATTLDRPPGTAPIPSSPTRQRVPAKPVTLARVMRAEWIKLTTLASSWGMLAAFLTAIVGFGLAAAASSSATATGDGQGPPIDAANPLGTVLLGANFGVLILGTFGALMGAREYGNRMITTTMTAVPARWPVVAAKAIVLTLVGFLVSLAALLVVVAGGMAILDGKGLPTVSLSDTGVLLDLVGVAAYLTSISLLGLGIGVLLRSVAGSITAVVGGILILPNVAAAMLPESYRSWLKYLPDQAAGAYTPLGEGGSELLSAGGGVAVTLAWLTVALGGAIWAVSRRDV